MFQICSANLASKPISATFTDYDDCRIIVAVKLRYFTGEIQRKWLTSVFFRFMLHCVVEQNVLGDLAQRKSPDKNVSRRSSFLNEDPKPGALRKRTDCTIVEHKDRYGRRSVATAKQLHNSRRLSCHHFVIIDAFANNQQVKRISFRLAWSLCACAAGFMTCRRAP